jgi:hypothetical protein
LIVLLAICVINLMVYFQQWKKTFKYSNTRSIHQTQQQQQQPNNGHTTLHRKSDTLTTPSNRTNPKADPTIKFLDETKK